MGQVSSSSPSSTLLKLENPGLPVPILTFGWSKAPPNLTEISATITSLKTQTFSFSTKPQHQSFFAILNHTHHVIPWEGSFKFIQTLRTLVVQVISCLSQISQNEVSLISTETGQNDFLQATQQFTSLLTDLENTLRILQDQEAPTSEVVSALTSAIKIFKDVLLHLHPSSSYFGKRYHIAAQICPAIYQLCRNIIMISKNTVVDGRIYGGLELDELERKYLQLVNSLRHKCIRERVKSCRIKVRIDLVNKVTYDFYEDLKDQFPLYFGVDLDGGGRETVEPVRLERSLKYQKLEGSAEVDVMDGWDSRKFSEISFTLFEIQPKDAGGNRKQLLYSQALYSYRANVVEIMEAYFKAFL